MNYQLVLQFRSDSLDTLDKVVAIEDLLTSRLNSEVDGHDIGSGEANIFILTDQPENDFAAAFPIVKDKGMTSSMVAAFRPVDDPAYKIIWPKDHLLPFHIK